jgi:hypothetical protein
MSETSTRFCNIHLGPGCGDEAYDAMFLLNRLTTGAALGRVGRRTPARNRNRGDT